MLQVVGKRVDVSLDGQWGEQAARTRIVAIGAAGAISVADLSQHFAACVVEGEGVLAR